MGPDTLQVSTSLVPPAPPAAPSPRPVAMDELRSLARRETGWATKFQMCSVCGVTGALAATLCACGNDFRAGDLAEYAPWESAPLKASKLRSIVRDTAAAVALLGIAVGGFVGVHSFVGRAGTAAPAPVKTSLLEVAAAEEAHVQATGTYTTNVRGFEPIMLDSVTLRAQLEGNGYCVAATASNQSWHYRNTDPQVLAGDC